jgi:hypothetical protein
MNIDTARGLIDYYSGLKGKFYPWGFAMNGMTSRLETLRQIIYACKIDRIIETGTFRGTTAEWFAQFGLPLETVEISERFYVFSRERLKRFPNVEIFHDSSVPYLSRRISERKADPESHQLFYLDSHWQDHLPLREELELIFHNYKRSIVVIDDFKVEDDAGYGFDSYSPEKTISLDYVQSIGLPGLRFFYPRTASSEETGARRGWVAIVNDASLAAILGNIQLLRSFKNFTD